MHGFDAILLLGAVVSIAAIVSARIGARVGHANESVLVFDTGSDTQGEGHRVTAAALKRRLG